MEQNANFTLTTAKELEIRDDPEALDKYSAQIHSHANMHGFAHAELLFDVIHGYKTRCETAAEIIQELLDSPKMEWSARDLEDALGWLTGPGVCDECGDTVGTLIGCPDGAEICRNCFESGAH